MTHYQYPDIARSDEVLAACGAVVSAESTSTCDPDSVDCKRCHRTYAWRSCFHCGQHEKCGDCH